MGGWEALTRLSTFIQETVDRLKEGMITSTGEEEEEEEEKEKVDGAITS